MSLPVTLAVIAGAGFAVAGTTPATSQSAPPAPSLAIRTDEVVLYSLPAGVRVADTITSPDARHVACVEEHTTGGERTYDVCVDGVAGPHVQWVIGKSLLFSPDGSRVTWQTQQDGPISVVVDTIDRLVHGGFSADAGPAVIGSGYWMAGHVLFSKDGRHVAFPAQQEKTRKSPWRMIVDGKAGDAFDALDDAQMVFSPDGSRLAYKATRGGKKLFVIDGVPGTGYDAVIAPIFSDNSARFAYVAKQGEDEFYVIDGKEGPRYEMTAALSFSGNGRRCAYAAGKAGKQMLIVDGKSYKPFDGIADLAFSPNGRRVAITAMDGAKWTAVIDGKESGAYDGAGALHFSPDGQRLAYVAFRGRHQFVIVDQAQSPPHDAIGSLSFSPDGKQIAYVAVDESARLLVVDGQKIGPVGSYAFSPDGRHIARTVPHPDGRWGLAIDGTETRATYDGFPLGSRLVFDSPATVRTIAGLDRDLVKVEMHVQ